MSQERATPVLATDDVEKTVAHYVDVLGFKKNWLWGSHPVDFGCVGLGATELYVSLAPEVAKRAEGNQVCLFVPNVDEMHDRQRSAGAEIVSPIANKPWGLREYTVRDPCGYRLRFGGPLKYERPRTALESMPDYIRIEDRLPTLLEYGALLDAVNWSKDEATMPGALAHACLGVVAVDSRDGRAVGEVRVTGDGRFYMIWDVIVVPAYQGQKIGSAMMERVLAELRKRNKPGAFVGLFTAKQGFYERYGFKNTGGGMHLTL